MSEMSPVVNSFFFTKKFLNPKILRIQINYKKLSKLTSLEKNPEFELSWQYGEPKSKFECTKSFNLSLIKQTLNSYCFWMKSNGQLIFLFNLFCFVT